MNAYCEKILWLYFAVVKGVLLSGFFPLVRRVTTKLNILWDGSGLYRAGKVSHLQATEDSFSSLMSIMAITVTRYKVAHMGDAVSVLSTTSKKQTKPQIQKNDSQSLSKTFKINAKEQRCCSGSM